MIFSRFFKKNEVIIEAEINMSETSSLNIISKSPGVTDKELIILGLLIFSRMLRIEVSKEEKFKLANIFIEFHTNYSQETDNKQFADTMMEVFRILSKPIKFKDSAKIRIKKASYLFLDMDNINVYPITSVVYATFISLWAILNEENRIRLSGSFSALASNYLNKPFSISEANKLPNYIASEVF